MQVNIPHMDAMAMLCVPLHICFVFVWQITSHLRHRIKDLALLSTNQNLRMDDFFWVGLTTTTTTTTTIQQQFNNNDLTESPSQSHAISNLPFARSIQPYLLRFSWCLEGTLWGSSHTFSSRGVRLDGPKVLYSLATGVFVGIHF